MTNLKFEIQRRHSKTFDMTIIKNTYNNKVIDTLLDTGARVPVWCSGETDLLFHYPDAIKQKTSLY